MFYLLRVFFRKSTCRMQLNFKDIPLSICSCFAFFFLILFILLCSCFVGCVLCMCKCIWCIWLCSVHCENCEHCVCVIVMSCMYCMSCVCLYCFGLERNIYSSCVMAKCAVRSKTLGNTLPFHQPMKDGRDTSDLVATAK